MKDLNKSFNYCKNILDKEDIKYGNIKSVSINTRAKKRYGQCNVVPEGYAINISSMLLDDSIRDSSLNNTVMHELLHTVNGCMNHGALWTKYANIINNKYGFNIKRTTSYEEVGIKQEYIQQEIIKHKFVCEKCGAVIERTRESKFTRNYQNYRCTRCYGRFKKLI